MSDKKYEDKPGYGAVFTNKNKTADHQPDFKGEFVDLDGTKKRIALWKRQSRGGTPYLSMKVEPAREAEKPAPEQTVHGDLNDDIPF